jgi:methylated-DNA-[protein]-cysteine S-methyltransferase
MALTAEFLTDTVPTPIGDMILIARDGVLLLLEFVEAGDRVAREMSKRFGAVPMQGARNPFGFSEKISAYFAGALSVIDDIPADGGGSAFETRVWAALRGIPCGETMSYGGVAKRIGNAKGMRAVGLANGRNPIAIVVPCHRVIGADGSLTGYGGGLKRKEWLLRHEGALLL